MGIRFYCPNGHKLNVKAFQAGRRGICPYCGAKIQIPQHSTRKSSKMDRAADQRPRAGMQVGSKTAGFSPGPPQGVSGVPSSQPGGSTAVRSPGFGSTPPAGEPPGYSSPMRADAPGPSPPAQPQQPSQAVLPHQAAPTGSASPVQEGATAGYASAPAGPDASASSTSVPRDPLSEGGEMVWYVRPPSGGQFGPAPPDTMRSWIDQGRVSPDSLVWREGWRDWQEAGSVFPQLGAGQEDSPFRQFERAAAAGPGATPASHRARSRRQSQSVQIAIVVALLLAVVLLFVVFLLVLMREDQEPSENARARAPAAATAPETAVWCAVPVN